VHFEETACHFRNARVTGVPVRPEFFSIPARAPNLPPTLLVFGGSQGAKAINKSVMGSLAALKAAVPGISIIHQTGERDYNDAQSAYVGSGLAADVSPFIQNMPEAFSRADVLLCRSGASTVAEITAAGKPAILVPFPRAADDHQLRNAQNLAQQGAAVLIPEAELSPERLAAVVAELLNDRPKLAAMSKAARALAHPNAAIEIAEMAATLAGPAGAKAQSVKVRI
jgi:UDP-N-acetylglucosamine--N-acetylmuramyl-(pentapeptide) pyrophosphoryl-undecaprenol N-acetylglucosamine transferase